MINLKSLATKVRNDLEKEYGSDLTGHCVEASDNLLSALKAVGIAARIVEGWCVWDDDRWGSDTPYGEHTWVELQDGTYIDVTADQFNPGMDADRKYPKILIFKGLPWGMRYEESIVRS